jgi:tryptophan 2,3-dioxygenase
MTDPRAPRPPLYYGDYLQLDKLLDSQHPKSGDGGPAAHDEMLFIIVHQAYELWFKQILHEVGSIIDLFRDEKMDDRNMGVVVARLRRVTEIQRVLNAQLGIIETMTALDFLDFRDHLLPASGFQSVQFRIIETSLGLRHGDRTAFSQDAYRSRLSEGDRALVSETEARPSLFDVVEAWLERTPFLDLGGYHFWDEYKTSVTTMLDEEEAIIKRNPTLSEEAIAEQLEALRVTRTSFRSMLDTDDAEAPASTRRLSDRATRGALFIFLYRDYPALQVPHNMLRLLLDVDELFTTWRHRHVLMAHRMIGRKIGTGGSAGHRYLHSAAMKHKVFSDLFDLSTYLLPRSALPTLPPEVERKLRFAYENE